MNPLAPFSRLGFFVTLFCLAIPGLNVAEPTPLVAAILVKQQTTVAQLGDTILVGVYGPFANEITNRLATDSATARKALRLYLNGVCMTGLVPEILPSEAFGPPPANSTSPELVL